MAFFFRHFRSVRACLLIVFIMLAGTAVAQPACDIEPTEFTPRTVAAVVDGDTLRLASGQTVRLIGINTPEMGGTQPLAREAQKALAMLIGPAQQVLLQDGPEDRDRHGRRLAHVYDISGRSVTVELLRLGLGFTVAISPNITRLGCLERAEADAIRAGLGVWALPAYRPLEVRKLVPGQGGFTRLRDRVTRVSFKDNGWWIQMGGTPLGGTPLGGTPPGGKVGLRIRPADQPLFDPGTLQTLQGRMVQARGWLVPMDRDWWMMTLSHPSMLVLQE